MARPASRDKRLHWGKGGGVPSASIQGRHELGLVARVSFIWGQSHRVAGACLWANQRNPAVAPGTGHALGTSAHTPEAAYGISTPKTSGTRRLCCTARQGPLARLAV